MLSGKVSQRLVEAINSAALAPGRWQDVAVELDEVICGGGVAIHFIDTAARLTYPIGATGFDPAFVESYIDYYAAISPWPEKFMVMPKGRARHSSMDIPEEDYVRTEFYQGWMRPQEDRVASVGIRTLGPGPRSLFATANLRRKDREKLAPYAARVFDWLQSHLSHASAVNDALTALSAQTAAYTADQMQASSSPGGAILIVTEDRMLAWADAGAVALFGSLLKLAQSGRLEFLDPDTQHWFEAVLAQASGSEPHRDGRLLETRLRSDHRLWVVRALAGTGQMPTNALVNFVNGEPSRTVVLVLKEQDIGSGPVDLLRRQYPLSAAEAEVALYLAEGLETEEIAHLRQVSRNTIRNQVQSVLAKLQARHRGDVVRIVSHLTPKT